MMSRVYIGLILILMIPISVQAQDEIELWLDGDDSDNYLLLEEEPWELDFGLPFLESPWMDLECLCDVLLGLCWDLDVEDEEMYKIFPDLWELDYELYLFWEYEWQY